MMKKKKNGTCEDSEKKERHIVSWTQEEDDILRQQISLHGTENWTIIASKFKDKTTRQCRRRWYTYLNSDFKKGGWSPEEDMLLCEAQRMFGNRWTEIAKVISGRTDNAVKNRFTTLCKKKAKYEAMAEDSKNSCVNSNNKRMLFPDGFGTEAKPENEVSVKKMRRSHILDRTAVHYGDRSHKKCDSTVNQQIKPPCSVLVQNVAAQNHVNVVRETVSNGSDKYVEGTYLKKDDPKMTALMQQAELLSSLAQKVNADNTENGMENAWKVLQNFLNKSKENDILRYGMANMDIQLEDFKDLLEDLRSTNEESQLSWRHPDLYESPASSEYSTGSTIMSQQTQAETHMMHKQDGSESQSIHVEEDRGIVSDANMDKVDIISGEDEFSSPMQVVPLFRSLAAGIPSPKFSESERNFLLKTLGIESPSPCPSSNPSQPPPCKRVLLPSL